jgi:hypothetical protein
VVAQRRPTLEQYRSCCRCRAAVFFDQLITLFLLNFSELQRVARKMVCVPTLRLISAKCDLATGSIWHPTNLMKGGITR